MEFKSLVTITTTNAIREYKSLVTVFPLELVKIRVKVDLLRAYPLVRVEF